MRTVKNNRKGFTLIELLVVVAIIALLVSILLPSLARARDLTKAVVCANRHKASYAGFNFYNNDFNGVFIAPWDQNPPNVANNVAYQWPYTMLFYVTGNPITDGKPLNDEGGSGWWSSEGRGGGAYAAEFADSPEEGPQIQCPEMAARGMLDNTMWYEYTSFSYAIPFRNNGSGTWNYQVSRYPKPDFMTHATSTVHMSCLSGIESEAQPNAWMPYNGSAPMNPHMDKANYTFYDGHVETLATKQTEEKMWADEWDRDDDTAPF